MLGVSVAAASENSQYGVMCYHNIVDESVPPDTSVSAYGGMDKEFRRQYFPQTMTAQKLVSHLNWLKSNGYTPVSWQQVKDARAGKSRLPAKPVLLTFDDGYISFYTTIYPILKAYNYPAVFALVTSWLDVPENGYVAYGKQKLPRKAFITWDQVREMQKSGLIEMASHSHDLHHSIIGNPFGSEFAAALPGKYENGHYETPAEYRQRIATDLRRSADIIQKNTGKRPTALVWPYGQFNQEATEIARQEGFDSDFTLYDLKLNQPETQHVGRFLLEQETDFGVIKSYLSGDGLEEPQIKRAVYVNLDDLYSPDVMQFNRNFDKLVSRMAKLGANIVYLQASSDENGDGLVDSAYFPNRHLKVKADLFSRVAWQLMTRSGVKVYAWMPMTAVDLGSGYDYVSLGKGLRRLSVANEKNRRAVAEIYEDLAFSSRFNGILFQDDTVFANFQNTLPEGVENNVEYWQQAQKNSDDLIAYTDQLKAAVIKYSFNGANELKIVRGLYAGAALSDKSQAWFADSLSKFVNHYDYTALTLTPYAQNDLQYNAKNTAKWINDVVRKVKKTELPLTKTIFALPAKNGYTGQPTPPAELAGWISNLKKEGVKNIAYYPDDFLQNEPTLNLIKPVFSVK